MVKVQIVDKTGKKVGDFTFDIKSQVRDDIYKKAVLSELSLFRQEKGADPLAGKRSAINVSKRRKAFRSTYGRGGSRNPKKVLWSRGSQMRFVGAFAPNTVGGRKAHAPKAQKILFKGLNNKEWLMAIQSGISASLSRDLVMANGQKVSENYPMVLDDSVEKMDKTKDFREMLTKLGFTDELERTSIRKVRAGKGTMRNRTYKTKRSFLVVVSSSEVPLFKSGRNFRGMDVLPADMLLASDFGMSEKPGRAVLFTKSGAEEFLEVLKE
jgi:large subunit ribosomal protein L4e